MQEKEFENISFDYYNNMPSFIRYGLNLLPEDKMLKIRKEIIKEIYNFILSSYSKEKLGEICTVSMLFESKMAKASNENRNRALDLIVNYVDRMIFDFYGRKELFSELENTMKTFTGYYGIFGKYDEVDSYENIDFSMKK